MTISKAKGAKAKADRLFSLIIRSRGYCENCGTTQNLQTAHIYSRRYSHTRCDPENAVCLCAGCHRYFTDRPVEFSSWLHGHVGVARLTRIREKSLLRSKVDWSEVVVELEEIASAMGVR